MGRPDAKWNGRLAKKETPRSHSALVGTLISRSAPPIDFKSKKGAIGSDPLFLSSDLCRIRALIAAPINGVEVCWSSVNYLFFNCRSFVRMKCDIPLPLISSQHRQRSRSGRGEALPARRRQREILIYIKMSQRDSISLRWKRRCSLQHPIFNLFSFLRCSYPHFYSSYFGTYISEEGLFVYELLVF